MSHPLAKRRALIGGSMNAVVRPDSTSLPSQPCGYRGGIGRYGRFSETQVYRLSNRLLALMTFPEDLSRASCSSVLASSIGAHAISLCDSGLQRLQQPSGMGDSFGCIYTPSRLLRSAATDSFASAVPHFFDIDVLPCRDDVPATYVYGPIDSDHSAMMLDQRRGTLGYFSLRGKYVVLPHLLVALAG